MKGAEIIKCTRPMKFERPMTSVRPIRMGIQDQGTKRINTYNIGDMSDMLIRTKGGWCGAKPMTYTDAVSYMGQREYLGEGRILQVNTNNRSAIVQIGGETHSVKIKRRANDYEYRADDIVDVYKGRNWLFMPCMHITHP